MSIIIKSGASGSLANVTTDGELSTAADNQTHNGTTWEKAKTANAANATTGTGIPAAGNLGFDGTNWHRLKAGAAGDLAVSITNPNSALAGMFASVTPFGALNVALDAMPIFSDAFEGGTFDTVNRWALAGTVAPTLAGSNLSINPGVTANATSVLTTLPNFILAGTTAFGIQITLEAAVTLGNHRFWGFGTAPTPPGTAAAPLQDAIGFEVDTAGILRASVYSGGTRIFTQALTRPTDGYPHIYAVDARGDISFFFMDTFDVPLAVGYTGPAVKTLPARLSSLNSAAVTVGTPTLSATGVSVLDPARTSAAISDGTYPWRKVQVGKSGGLAVKGATLPAVSGAVAVATPATIGPADVADAGNATFIVKNTVAASAWAGAPVLVFEQSDDNVSWGPLLTVRSDTAAAASTFTLGVGVANASLMFDAAVEGVNWVRCRATTAPTTNGLTVVIQPGGMAYAPVVTSIAAAPAGVTGNGASTVTAAADTLLIAANAARKGLAVFNDSTAALYLSMGTTAASLTVFTCKIAAGSYYEVPFGYTGAVRGIWSAATGAARLTEVIN